MKKAILFFVLFFSSIVIAETIFKIEIGDKKGNSNRELQERILDLERAVWQLQRKIYKLESEDSNKSLQSWSCTIEAMGNKFIGIGRTQPEAQKEALKECKSENDGDTFFCKNEKCTNK
jgi:hypothetical protein